jgi:hypothetical protein
MRNIKGQRMLAREFIYDRLYNKDNGYFIKEDLQVG